MRWPWVWREEVEKVRQRWQAEVDRLVNEMDEVREDQREARAELKEQVVWLRGRNEALEEQLTRVVRFQTGMSEVPREPRPQLEPMPKRLAEYIKAHDSAQLQKEMRDQLYRRHGRGESWDVMMAEVFSREGEGDE